MFFYFLLCFPLPCFNTGQCSPYRVAFPSISSTQMTITWECNDGGSSDMSQFEYQVTYQLLDRDQCGTGSSYVGLHKTDFMRFKADGITGGGVFQYSLILSELLPHSTYELYVVSRTPGRVFTTRSNPASHQTTGETGKV